MNNLLERLLEQLNYATTDKAIDDSSIADLIRLEDIKDKEAILDYINSFDKSSIKNSKQTLYRSYLSNAIRSSPALSRFEGKATLYLVSSTLDKTETMTYNDKVVILFDAMTYEFLWMMTKTYVQLHGDNEAQYNSYKKILSHFALKFVPPRPHSLPNENISTLSTVELITSTQEYFVICHELAHHLIHQDEIPVNDYSDFVLDMFVQKPRNCNEEILADKLAFDMTRNCIINDLGEKVNALPNYEEYIFVLVALAVFLFIRFYMFRGVILSEIYEDDAEYAIWAYRNSAFRDLVMNEYKWKNPDFLSPILTELEQTLEVSTNDIVTELKKIDITKLQKSLLEIEEIVKQHSKKNMGSEGI